MSFSLCIFEDDENLNKKFASSGVYDPIFSLSCQKILWIGPVGFDSLQNCISGTKLALIIKNTCGSSCDVTVVGHAACMSFVKMEKYPKEYKLIANAAAVWDFLKGRTLPGVAALDKVCSLLVYMVSHFM